MSFFENVHLGAVLATLINELESWSMDKPFCKAILAFFAIGCVAQFLLLRMRWKPWLVSLTLGMLIIFLDFLCMAITGFVYDLFGLMEMFFIAALFGAGLAGAVHIFWEIFKKRPEGSGSVWLLNTDAKKDEE